ncbi:MAG: PIN domain-containing protein [Anaerolineae bacterium]|nr:PIN domain-containing protein [Anaerolineae bacterium]
MVTCLLDTNILVDLLRGYAPAASWLVSQVNPGISRATWLEIIEGARDLTKQREALTLLDTFEVVEFTDADFAWAASNLLRFSLSHRVDSFDCLIAAPAQRLRVPLYTRNLKHFTPLLGDLAAMAYG